MRSWFSSIQIEQPVAQPVQTPACRRRNQTRCLIQKVLVAQRPDGAEIDHVARELVVQREAGHHVDFFVRAAAGDHQFARAADFPREADAAAAQDAAIDEQRHVADVAPPAGEGCRSARRSSWPCSKW